MTLALLSLACNTPDAGRPPPRAEPPADPGHLDLGSFEARNVVVVHVDTLRADALRAWGGPRDTTPLLGGRSGWTSVARALTTASWTVPSTASLLAGVDLPTHGLRYFDEAGPSGALAAPTFAEHFRQAGWRTALFSGSSLLLGPEIGLGFGFEHAQELGAEPGNAASTVDAALAWLETLPADVPTFVFLQPVDPHGPYRPEDVDVGTWIDPATIPFDLLAPAQVQESQIQAALAAATTEEERAAVLEQVRVVYDEQVLGVDRAVESLIAGLERLGRGDDTLVVVSADHGESFHDGYPTMLGHGRTLRDELVHVPLLFWGADVPDAHVDCVASNMDVLPTVLDAAGLQPLAGAEGRSLLESCRTHAFSGTYEAGDAGEVLTWLAVGGLDAQLVTDCGSGERYAFDLAADPGATEPVQVSDVPGGTALAGALDDYTEEVLATLPWLACP